ncbi:MAG: alpha/beta hydrolase [Pseudomonadota bacterium]
MTLDPAPLYDDVALGPQGGRAYWLSCDDGTRIRMAIWPLSDAKGTVLMFPGRTEYIEKYGRLAEDFAAAGLAMITIDWRGQGLSDRPLPQRDIGYVESFAEYQQDVAALKAALADMEEAPKPWHLLAHSMGGAIGLRALYDGLDVSGVAFTAPMWGIAMSPISRIFARFLQFAARPLRIDRRFAPSTGPAKPMDFSDNRLTTDREQFLYMENQTQTYPDLALGGPSIRWLTEALAETAALMEMPAPPKPALNLIGTEEKIVVVPVARRRMSTWPGGDLLMIDGAEHEVLMEAPDKRGPALAKVIAWFDAQ